MKMFFLVFSAAAVYAAALYSIRNPLQADENLSIKETINERKLSFNGCSPNLRFINFQDSLNTIPILDGWGSHRMRITSASDSAELFFQQGINMYYGFHIIEALASFEKALRLEPDFAMAHWGKALAYGPNINDIGYAASPEALEAVRQAKHLSEKISQEEKALIDAITVRYSPDASKSREKLNRDYAEAMKRAWEKFPDNSDIAALYADALMIEHPWDLYDKEYEPKTWTPPIVAVLEKLVKQFPEHPGAMHYYIHAVEGSTNPHKALKVADKLGTMMPGLSHLVHMPSHIYIRSGYYDKGVQSNERAVRAFRVQKEKYPVVANGAFLYETHNLHMQATCANMDARFEEAMRLSNLTQASVDASWFGAGGYFSMYGQFLYMTPYFTLIRFGRWDELLRSDNVADSLVYAYKIWQYGQGLAHARKGNINAAKAALKNLTAPSASDQLSEHPPTFNEGMMAILVASELLNGVIAEEEGRIEEAINSFQKAVDIEDGMFYNEPKDWPHPARHYLGNALLKNNRLMEAERVYKKDLQQNPNNPWALTGLHAVYKALKNKRLEADFARKAQTALERSDVNLEGSVF